jgi:hypothetical protein
LTSYRRRLRRRGLEIPRRKITVAVRAKEPGSGMVVWTATTVGAVIVIGPPPPNGGVVESVANVWGTGDEELISVTRSAPVGLNVGISKPELSRIANENSSGCGPASTFVVVVKTKLRVLPGVNCSVNKFKKELSVMVIPVDKSPETPPNRVGPPIAAPPAPKAKSLSVTLLFASSVPLPSVNWKLRKNGAAGCPMRGVVLRLTSNATASARPEVGNKANNITIFVRLFIAEVLFTWFRYLRARGCYK